ncbi:MAG: hypothetical protein HY940_01395 [Gammaproteobacteria bacterium]|nr:hypothetical protein [Gammaproteobacteria bacterium]
MPPDQHPLLRYIPPLDPLLYPDSALAHSWPLQRRGTPLGAITELHRTSRQPPEAARTAWQSAQPVLLPGLASERLGQYALDIAAAHTLMEQMLDGEHTIDELLEQPPYQTRLQPHFEMLASSQDESDLQEIETLEFDAIADGETTAENLWLKISWLSYDEDDPSLRFRFSFGLPGYEDVASDLPRQRAAAALTEAVFPESALISRHSQLKQLLCALLDCRDIEYVERIIYFNAPNGGAQFHQDVERGHDGVVFLQASGRTFWFALAKSLLIDEITTFVRDPQQALALAAILPDMAQRKRLQQTCHDRIQLSAWLDDHDDNEPLEMLLNRCPAFTRQLVEHGHGYVLHPGDMILLPQGDHEHCCWHTVFCLGDETGEGLSFAIRRV